MRVELVKNELILRKNKRERRNEKVYGLITILIPLVGFLVFSFVPMIISLWTSFQQPGDGNVRFEEMTFVGWNNFKFVLTDPRFWTAVGDTLLNCLVTPLCMVFGLIIAMLVSNPKLRGRTVFKAVFFLPYVCSIVATCSIWKMLLNPTFGPFNKILTSIGLGALDLNNPSQTMPIMIFLGVWSGVGFSIIMYSAALTNIDSGVVEASKVDGANAWQRFWNVTFPGVMPVSFFLLVTGIIGNLQDFTRFQILLPASSKRGVTIAYYLYDKLANTSPSTATISGAGIASAASWCLTILIIGISVIQFMANKKQGDSTK
ncbi:MAG: sugar ABC transporter permease [Bacilli bacterium]|nr:sugar ABC transporter permease [Bacilli bacterium]